MADEATPQETTAPADIVEATEAVVGGADQATTEATDTQEPAVADTDTPAEDTAPAEERTYTKAEVKKFKDEAQKLRQRLRDETEAAAKAAAEASEKAVAERIGKALGLIPEENDKPVDPAVLLEQAAEREAQIANERDQIASKLRAYELEKALSKAATAVDGDLDILTPYLKGTGALDALDPDADDYLDQVSAVVAAAVEANPKLRKAAPVAAPPRSGGDLSGGTANPRTKNPTDIDGWRKKLFGDGN